MSKFNNSPHSAFSWISAESFPTMPAVGGKRAKFNQDELFLLDHYSGLDGLQMIISPRFRVIMREEMERQERRREIQKNERFIENNI